eukprot:Phypoly_transcript_01248.p1 GENE.Phypoly_transcript_01248~~Phypoly_transcript_01248.p1  ORF type:complete len:1053 (+),score=118.16 Phypoly_transcript_01248:360-3518(+)
MDALCILLKTSQHVTHKTQAKLSEVISKLDDPQRKILLQSIIGSDPCFRTAMKTRLRFKNLRIFDSPKQKKLVNKQIVIMMGPPSSGKTFLANAMAEEMEGTTFSLGDIIRDNKLEDFPAHFFKELYYSWIEEAMCKFKKSTKSIFVLDAIKDTADAQKVIDISQKLEIPITNIIVMEHVFDTTRFGRDYNNEVKVIRYTKYATNFLPLLSLYTRNGIPLSTPASESRWPSYMRTKSLTASLLAFNTQEYELETIHPEVYQELTNLLEVSGFEPSYPSAFLKTKQQFDWVCDPTNYSVSHKVDGVRNILMSLPNETYIMNRSQQMKSVNVLCGIRAPYQQIPPNTILDGELVQIDGRKIFIMFDLLCLEGAVMWDLPFSIRQSKLKSISSLSTSSQLPLDDLPAHSVWVVAKEYYPSTIETIANLLSVKPWFPVDGLIFTHPMGYVFGKDYMLFKWQPLDKIRCEVLSPLVPLLDLAMFPHQSRVHRDPKLSVHVYEWNNALQLWQVISVRTDKQTGNSLKVIQELTEICRCPFPLFGFINLNKTAQGAEHEAHQKSTSRNNYRTIREMDFDTLLQTALSLQQEDKITHFFDPETELDIFNYKIQSEQTQLFRGLVLHTATKTVVTTPFTNFCSHENEREVDPNEIVEVFEKIDGSLGIGFLWQGKIYVATRKRLDSEQSIWATEWIRKNTDTSVMQEGWTYLFEIVYPDNRVIIIYPYSGLVLLACVSPEGEELEYTQLLELADRLNRGRTSKGPKVRVPFRFCTKFSEAIPQLRQLVGSDLRCEGGIIKCKNGMRLKFVSDAWKNTFRSALDIHPQIIWQYMRYTKLPYLLSCLPMHLHGEVRAIALALDAQFRKIRPLAGLSKSRKRLARFDQKLDLSPPEYQAKALEFIRYWRLDPEAGSSWSESGAWSFFEYHHQVIMNTIKPKGLSIDGYSPSTHFKQTFAKGWQVLPETSISRFPQNYNSWLFTFPREVLIHILSFSSLGISTRVCFDFWVMIENNAELTDTKDAQRFDVCMQQQAEAERRQRKRDGYGSDFEKDDRLDGYNSYG